MKDKKIGTLECEYMWTMNGIYMCKARLTPCKLMYEVAGCDVAEREEAFFEAMKKIVTEGEKNDKD